MKKSRPCWDRLPEQTKDSQQGLLKIQKESQILIGKILCKD